MPPTRLTSCILVLLVFSQCIGSFRDAEALYLSGRYEEAIEAFNKVLFVSTTDLKSLHLRARSYEELEMYDFAIKDYRRILALEPTYAQAYAGIGKIAWEKKNMKEAEQNFLLAAMHDPSDYDILVLLSRAMIKNGRYKSAVEFLDEAIVLKPEEPMPHYYKGIAQAYSGDGLGVIVSFNKYLEIEPDNLSAHYNRGFALMKLGYCSWAVEDFDKVLEENPRHYDALARRALCLLEKNPRQACFDLETAAINGNLLAKANLNRCQAFR
ncbi:Tetratricopeptide repeat-containing protein [Cyclobacterium lianum]|uniref:Tetratricopeptide repeat-containing protein n=1 Tax=Cyclobacterium lianum TaxID=388280 RepID=A0A1M7MJZ5_9BACT|nr:tetratricopeptide repeat protein [Cyclobacterium lianum]SHM91195.1 Tetratricopeptide repeat-containing protein [Cyclobacterium lianum]